MKQKKIIWNLKSPPKRKSNSFLRKQNKDQSGYDPKAEVFMQSIQSSYYKYDYYTQ